MSSSNFELTLAREAQLMYQRTRGFEPVKGDLTRWKGEIAGRGEFRGLKFEVEIKVPPTFPMDPPQVRMISPTEHPNVDIETGRVKLNILEQWRPEYHLYHVVNTLKGAFARIPPSPATKRVKAEKEAPKVTVTIVDEVESAQLKEEVSPEIPQKLTELEKETQKLKRMLQERDEEIAMLRGRLSAHNVPEVAEERPEPTLLPEDPLYREVLDIESEKIAVEDLIRTLEEKFEAGEIGPTEYTKLYKRYKKQLYIANKKLEKLRAT
ncbi:MAG: ubiquitin-conjugating enzyme E2 [Candidatus Jordarchaeaceae archaeon]